MRRRWLALGVGAFALAGCRTPTSLDWLSQSLPYQRGLETAEGRFRIELPTASPSEELLVAQALEGAGPALAQWGKFERPVTVFVLPSHAALEALLPVRAESLKAWADSDHVYLQAPRTWGPEGANLRQVTETLTHELTHTLMFQLAGADQADRRLEFPLWFREGMALTTARQQATVPTLESLARYLLSRPAHDPLRDEAHAYDGPAAFDMAYAAGLHAFHFLLARYGQTSVRTLLNAMRAGARFDDAFTASMGISPAAFLNDFETFVRLRGFAQGRALRRPQVK